ncbi:MAG: 30S ribosomal protein S8e [Methanobacteriaceae archaeon]|nr:30S ribosomal protein S8e [Methanobacteriaceae archaeon]
MAIWQGDSLRKPTGARSIRHQNKRNAEFGRIPSETKIGDEIRKTIETRGGNQKIRATSAKKINVVNPADNTTQTVEMKTVLENNANAHFVRRNIITKGALIETDIGTVKITSRPGQDGIINGILTE